MKHILSLLLAATLATHGQGTGGGTVNPDGVGVNPTAFKTALSLQNVTNTSDANKPVSDATVTALAGKQAPWSETINSYSANFTLSGADNNRMLQISTAITVTLPNASTLPGHRSYFNTVFGSVTFTGASILSGDYGVIGSIPGSRFLVVYSVGGNWHGQWVKEPLVISDGALTIAKTSLLQNALDTPVNPDKLFWTRKSIEDARGASHAFLLRYFGQGDSTRVDPGDNIRGAFGLYGSIGQGGLSGGAVTCGQHERYDVSPSGYINLLTASGHTVTFSGTFGPGNNMQPAHIAHVIYVRKSGGGTFQTEFKNSVGSWIPIGSAVSTAGAAGIGVFEENLASPMGFSIYGTEVRAVWVSGSVDIIAGGVTSQPGNVNASTNRQGGIGINMGTNSANPTHWNTTSQTHMNDWFTWLKPQIVFISDKKGPLSLQSTATWLSGVQAYMLKCQTARKAASTATLDVTRFGLASMRFTAVASGIAGESIRVKFSITGPSVATTTVSVSGNDITVSLKSNASSEVAATTAEVVSAVNGHAPAAALVTATNLSGPAPDKNIGFWPLSCGVGVDFVMVGTAPARVDEGEDALQDAAMKEYCAANKILFVETRKFMPTFEECVRLGYLDSDEIHLTVSGKRVVEGIIWEHLELQKLAQTWRSTAARMTPQFYGSGAQGSWLSAFNATTEVASFGMRRTDAGISNTGEFWEMRNARTADGYGSINNGIIESWFGAPWRQMGPNGNAVIGLINPITRAPNARLEVWAPNAVTKGLIVSGASDVAVNLMEVRTSASFSAAGTLKAGYTATGVPFDTLTSYANDAAADADATLPSGGHYLITGGRTVFRKP